MDKDFTNDSIIHVKNSSGFEYIQFRRLLEYQDIVNHCFTTRKGGVSEKPFDSLNLLLTSTTEDEKIKNYQVVCDEFKFDISRIVPSKQVHGDVIRKVDDSHKGEGITTAQSPLDYDALITNSHKVPIMTLSADCTLILLFDPTKKVIASVHSGWKGTLLNIVGKTVGKMKQEYECNEKDIIAAIGPSARECCFEFGLEGLDIFDKKYIIKNVDKEDKINIKVVDILKDQMIKEGLLKNNILDSKVCTICNSDLFYSYRVQKENAGRQAAFIELI